MSGLRWIFFDMGSTLLDEREQNYTLYRDLREAFRKYGKVYSDEECERAMYEGAKQHGRMLQNAIRLLSNSQQQYDDVVAKVDYTHQDEKLYPGVAPMLEYLKGRYKLGIIANQSLGGEDRLRRHDIHRYFDVFALSAELRMKKPAHAFFQYALDEAKCKASEAVYVGDRIDNDVYPARQMGFVTVRVLQGFAIGQEIPGPDYEPDYTIKDIADLTKIF